MSSKREIRFADDLKWRAVYSRSESPLWSEKADVTPYPPPTFLTCKNDKTWHDAQVPESGGKSYLSFKFYNGTLEYRTDLDWNH